MSDKFVCGIEGGATHSTAVVLDLNGNKKGELLDEPATNHWLLGEEECCKLLASIIKKALNQSGISDESALVGIGLCLSGCEDEKTNQELKRIMQAKLPQVQNVVVASDTVSPITAASDKGGIVLISGTGSNCLLVNPDGSTGRCGGWGYMLGDEGSAYWIAYKAVKICMLEQDNYEAPPHDTTYVWQAIRTHFDVEDRFGLLAHSHGDFNKPFYASLTIKLSEGAQKGDKLCQHLFYMCGEELAKHILAVKKDIQPELYDGPHGLLIVCTGSVWKSWKYLQPGFEYHLGLSNGQTPRMQKFSLVSLTVPASTGAALIAARQFGVVPKDLEKNFTVFYSCNNGNLV